MINKHKIIKQLLLSIVIAIVTAIIGLNAFAVNGNAGGSGSTGAVGGMNGGGFSDGSVGYRIYLVDSKSPKVVSPVIDILFKAPQNIAVRGVSTGVGSGTVSKAVQAASYGLSKMPQPIKWSGMTCIENGQGLKRWMLTGNKSQSNANKLVVRLFGQAYNNQLMSGKIKLVIEGVYWYRPVNKKWPNPQLILGRGQNVYGTIKDIAKWEAANASRIGDQYGGQMSKLVQKVWPTALMIVRPETTWGITPPSKGGQVTYGQIISAVGYGMQVYDAKTLGGSGSDDNLIQTYDDSLMVPGPAPEIEGEENITIIKLYTEKTPSGEKFIGCYKRTGTPGTIEVMDEDLGQNGKFKCMEWETSTIDRRLTDWSQVPEAIRGAAGTGTVEVQTSEKVLYVWLRKTSAGDDGEANMEIQESEINKAYQSQNVDGWGTKEMQFNWQSMAGTCDAQIVTGSHRDPLETDSKTGAVTKWSDPINEYSNCGNQYSVLDQHWAYKFKESDGDDQTILTTKDPFKAKIEASNDSGDISGVDAGSNNVTDINAKFVVWRGTDIPTLVSWKGTSGASISSLIGQAAAEPQHERKVQDYKQATNLTIQLDKDNSDVNTSGGCSSHNDHKVEVEHTSSGDITLKGTTLVHVYSGQEKTVAEEVPDESKLQLSEKENDILKRVRKTITKSDYENLVFYPYIQMTYQNPGDSDGTKNNVFIIQQHRSEMKVTAAMSVYWEKKTTGDGYNMALISDQWSNHASAVSGDKKWNTKNNVLPGGAIYGLTTNQAGKQLGTKITVTGYYPFVPDAVKNEIISCDQSWNSTIGKTETTSVVKGIENTINSSYKLAMYADKWSNNTDTKRATAFNGTRILKNVGLSGVTGANNKTNSDDKYYLLDVKNKANSNNLNAHAQSVAETIYTFSQDLYGNILMNGQVILTKTQGPEALTGIAKTIDDYTKVVTNLCDSLTRNAGNDSSASWATSDGHWYNEMYDGIQIGVYTATIDVGLDSYEGLSYRTTVMDPNICPSQTGTSNAFSKASIFQYKVDTGSDKQKLGTALGQQVDIPNGDVILVQRPAWVPNVTVQALD